MHTRVHNKHTTYTYNILTKTVICDRRIGISKFMLIQYIIQSAQTEVCLTDSLSDRTMCNITLI